MKSFAPCWTGHGCPWWKQGRCLFRHKDSQQQEETLCLRDVKQQQQKLLKRFGYLLAVQLQEVLGHEAEEERVDIVQTTASRSESSESGRQRRLGRLRQLHTAALEDIIEMAQNVPQVHSSKSKLKADTFASRKAPQKRTHNR